MKLRVRSNWDHTILVCAKCSKKLDGGFGPKGRTPLAKALRKHLGLKKGRKAEAGIVEVKCMGICPRGAVTVIDAGGPREWLIVPKGADLDGVADELGLGRDR
ncbi:(2Fe-2S) ferredoxin domain-containing protein [Sphingomonas sp. HITSZ_GF]|uniref:(2Fe-2S) ferredoxin domain-containing protein n=1 Tax=Sphingomonas sp. HITSZ_GF TaxID=3037247 RepID=UPI00240DDD71|nr:(2Fe-2S) ferredoxin domain-containing protein [Sphingomonas sp. HITSZ_GF]MDG2532388.1 (2Fe-2S) ferredoxin domain-containing protein [Sphingomonas sp. HITSZ_GF]